MTTPPHPHLHHSPSPSPSPSPNQVAAKLATTPATIERCVQSTLAAAQARAAGTYPALLALMVEAVRWNQRQGLLQFEPQSGGAGLWTSGAIGRAIFLSGLKVEQGVAVHARLVQCIQPTTPCIQRATPCVHPVQPCVSCNPVYPRCARRRHW